jgi:adenylate cyclase
MIVRSGNYGNHMATEIERKFLVSSEAWREGPPGTPICQGYLCKDPERSVRVRIKGEAGFLTVKGGSSGIAREEFEYPVPVEDARCLLGMCLPPLLEKVRYERWHEGRCWEIDEFGGLNAGLVVAEVELPDVSADLALPPWAGKEVSDDPRYYNLSLVDHPWFEWGRE